VNYLTCWICRINNALARSHGQTSSQQQSATTKILGKVQGIKDKVGEEQGQRSSLQGSGGWQYSKTSG
jgi:hypothetical protein